MQLPFIEPPFIQTPEQYEQTARSRVVGNVISGSTLEAVRNRPASNGGPGQIWDSAAGVYVNRGDLPTAC